MCSVEDDLLLFSHRQVITHILGEGISRAPETILPKAGSRFNGTTEFFKKIGVRTAIHGDKKQEKKVGMEGALKYYFKLRIANGEGSEAFTDAFQKKVYEHPAYQVLVMYDGDDAAVNPKYCHGNAEKPGKTENPFYPTTPSVKAIVKQRQNEAPAKMHGDLIDAAGPGIRVQVVQASRDIQQIQNFQRLARQKTKISHDAQYNAYEVGIVTNFLQKFEVHPELNLVCLHPGMLAFHNITSCSLV